MWQLTSSEEPLDDPWFQAVQPDSQHSPNRFHVGLWFSDTTLAMRRKSGDLAHYEPITSPRNTDGPAPKHQQYSGNRCQCRRQRHQSLRPYVHGRSLPCWPAPFRGSPGLIAPISSPPRWITVGTPCRADWPPQESTSTVERCVGYTWHLSVSPWIGWHS